LDDSRELALVITEGAGHVRRSLSDWNLCVNLSFACSR
jgi:hypothetical protein